MSPARRPVIPPAVYSPGLRSTPPSAKPQPLQAKGAQLSRFPLHSKLAQTKNAFGLAPSPYSPNSITRQFPVVANARRANAALAPAFPRLPQRIQTKRIVTESLATRQPVGVKRQLPPIVKVLQTKSLPVVGIKSSLIQRAAQGSTQFPHGGKHRPPDDAYTTFKNVKKINHKNLAALTQGTNKVSLYASANPVEVIKWESEAIKDGLNLKDSFTMIHRFNEIIGASNGQTTNIIRMDGLHHGHPITETEADEILNDEWESMRADLDSANQHRLAELLSWIKKVGYKHPKLLREIDQFLAKKYK